MFDVERLEGGQRMNILLDSGAPDVNPTRVGRRGNSPWIRRVIVPTLTLATTALLTWARLIAKVYEVDPLICPRCGSEMKLIAVITNPPEVANILRHLIKIGRAPPGLHPSSLN